MTERAFCKLSDKSERAVHDSCRKYSYQTNLSGQCMIQAGNAAQNFFADTTEKGLVFGLAQTTIEVVLKAARGRRGGLQSAATQRCLPAPSMSIISWETVE